VIGAERGVIRLRGPEILLRFFGGERLGCALDPLRCCHVFNFVQFLYMCQHFNRSSALVHWTQATPFFVIVNQSIGGMKPLISMFCAALQIYRGKT
jgi:hypothetical protein